MYSTGPQELSAALRYHKFMNKSCHRT